MKKGEYHSFKCKTCEDKKTGEAPIFRAPGYARKLAEHLKTAHNLSDLRGIQSLVIHLDEPEYYRSVYDWDVHGIKLAETLRFKRDKLGADMWRE